MLLAVGVEGQIAIGWQVVAKMVERVSSA